MAFTTSVFFFMFLPVMMLVFFSADFLSRKVSFFRRLRLPDLAMVLLSAFFYAWACADHMLWLLLFMVLIYFLGRLIEYTRPLYVRLPVYRKEGSDFRQIRMLPLGSAVCALAVAVTVTILLRYKYANFLNESFAFLGVHFPGGAMSLAPLGISFIVFSAVSYLADIRMGKARAGNFLDCALYLCFFPKIVSGPIVLWRDFAPQIRPRRASLDRFVSGFNRISIGFCKKVLLADFFGLTISRIDQQGLAGIDNPTVWLCVVLYMLQIYYDFAGYSDIAVGLCRILGFDCKENFCFPYRSQSITEFWKRWHISLGSWFREYIYIPLGGNRKGLRRTLINLGVVFAVTGIWHGASWAYILWGAINGLLVITERLCMQKPFYKKIPGLLKWAFTMFIVMLFWQLFRFASASDALDWILQLFRPGNALPLYTWRYFLDTKLTVMMALAIGGATVLGAPRIQSGWKKFSSTAPGFAVQELALAALMVLSLIGVVSSTYSPFIYFQY